jgi:hypothetical protein
VWLNEVMGTSNGTDVMDPPAHVRGVLPGRAGQCRFGGLRVSAVVAITGGSARCGSMPARHSGVIHSFPRALFFSLARLHHCRNQVAWLVGCARSNVTPDRFPPASKLPVYLPLVPFGQSTPNSKESPRNSPFRLASAPLLATLADP